MFRDVNGLSWKIQKHEIFIGGSYFNKQQMLQKTNCQIISITRWSKPISWARFTSVFQFIPLEITLAKETSLNISTLINFLIHVIILFWLSHKSSFFSCLYISFLWKSPSNLKVFILHVMWSIVMHLRLLVVILLEYHLQCVVEAYSTQVCL